MLSGIPMESVTLSVVVPKGYEVRTQILKWFVEVGYIDGGGVGRWEETIESIETPSKELADKIRDEWLASGKLSRTLWGGIRPSGVDYGAFRIRSEWVNV